jgi:hypothetical protein
MGTRFPRAMIFLPYHVARSKRGSSIRPAFAEKIAAFL